MSQFRTLAPGPPPRERMQRNPHLHGNRGDRIPRLMRAAGFAEAAEAGARASLIGPQAHWTAIAGG